MAKILAVSLVVLAFVSGTSALTMIFNDPKYRDACSDYKESVSIPVEDPCDLENYIMCSNGQAMVLNRCPSGTPRFDKDTQQCQLAADVELPASCQGHSSSKKVTSCADGADTLANATTCRKYIVCASGRAIAMYCQRGSYFEGDRCKSYELHYRHAFDPARLKHCEELDKIVTPEMLQKELEDQMKRFNPNLGSLNNNRVNPKRGYPRNNRFNPTPGYRRPSTTTRRYYRNNFRN